MDKLTIEEKAQRYDELSKEVKDFFDGKQKMYSDVKQTLNYLFPELRDSEDERIRKSIISGMKALQEKGKYTCFANIPMNIVLNWLENQGEQRSITIDVDKMVSKYSHTEDGNFGLPVNCQIRAYKQGVNDVLNLLSGIEQKPVDKIQLGKKYKCIASPRYSTFMIGQIYKPEDEFLCSFMNFCSDCFEPIEDSEQKPIFNAEHWYVSKVDGQIHDMTYNPADNFEPKFKVGDWIVYKDNVWKICNISLKTYYELLNINNEVSTRHIEDVDKDYHLWTIQDAKDGDMLIGNYGIFIFMGENDGYCGVLSDNTFIRSTGNNEWTEDLYPATKEQRDTLMKAMADAGYTFDFEKKEVRKKQKPIENKGMNLVKEEMTPFQKKVFCIIDTAIEEEQGLKQVCDELLTLASNEIKQKPTEWNKRDEEMIEGLNNCLDELEEENGWYYVYVNNKNVKLNNIRNWLKSLKPQKHWKPSELQIKALESATAYCIYGEYESYLKELIEQLKQL